MKKLLPLFFSVLLAISALCVTAGASSYDSVAQELAGIGMFRGTADGFELDRAPIRSEAAIMLVRLYGAEDAAKTAYAAGQISHPFQDVSEFSSPYVAWLYTNGIANGSDAATFGSTNPCSVKQYCAFLLRALGYRDGTDFAYADTLTFAQEKGLYEASMFSGAFLRDDLAAVTYQALGCDLKDGSGYLLSSLIQSGAVDADAAAPITQKIDGYRTLLASSDDLLSSSMDLDIVSATSANITMTGTSEGQPVHETQVIAANITGSMKVITGASPQMAFTSTVTAMGTTTESNTWIKDGWIYLQNGEEAYKVESSDILADYDALLSSQVSAMNLAMLPMIDQISAKKSGASTVYTLKLNDSMGGLFDAADGLLDLLSSGAGLSMDISVKDYTCTYTFTGNKLSRAAATVDLSMQMVLSNEGDTLHANADYTVNMDMKVNATGNAVSITYPDLSAFPLMDFSQQ